MPSQKLLINSLISNLPQYRNHLIPASYAVWQCIITSYIPVFPSLFGNHLSVQLCLRYFNGFMGAQQQRDTEKRIFNKSGFY